MVAGVSQFQLFPTAHRAHVFPTVHSVPCPELEISDDGSIYTMETSKCNQDLPKALSLPESRASNVCQHTTAQGRVSAPELGVSSRACSLLEPQLSIPVRYQTAYLVLGLIFVVRDVRTK